MEKMCFMYPFPVMFKTRQSQIIDSKKTKAIEANYILVLKEKNLIKKLKHKTVFHLYVNDKWEKLTLNTLF